MKKFWVPFAVILILVGGYFVLGYNKPSPDIADAQLFVVAQRYIREHSVEGMEFDLELSRRVDN